MKLRVRSLETKVTIKVEIPDLSSLQDLKSLIAIKLSLPVPPDSIKISLNRKDELLSSSPCDPLPSLGLTSGDLIFFSISPTPETLTLAPHPNSNPIPETMGFDDSPIESNPVQESPGPQEGGKSESERDLVDMCSESEPIAPETLTLAPEPPNSPQELVPRDLGRVVHAIHTIFLDSGFLVPGGSGNGPDLPDGWASSATMFSVPYTVSNAKNLGEAKIAILKFLTMGEKYVSVYGFVRGNRPDVYRMCFDVQQVASFVDGICEKKKDVLQLWRTVKDGLATPLLIDLCDRNGLPLPPCFARLPSELKLKILEFLPGVDVVRAGCTSTELWCLSLGDELWEQKFKEEFGSIDVKAMAGSDWKTNYVIFWSKAKNANKRSRREPTIIVPNSFLFSANRRYPFAPPMIPVIGGDYDMLPYINHFGSRIGFPQGRRNCSPLCHFNGPSFPM